MATGRVGLITYMRTDSTNLSEARCRDPRAIVGQTYGGDFLPEAPRVYKSTQGGAGSPRGDPSYVATRSPPERSARSWRRNLRRLYTLIWQRAVASQMATAVLDSVAVDIDAAPTAGRRLPAAASGSPSQVPRLPRPSTTGTGGSSHRRRRSHAVTAEDEQPRAAAGDDRGRPAGPARPHAASSTSPSRRRATRGHAREGARRERHRPSVDLRADPRDDPDAHYVEKEGERFKPTELGHAGQRPDGRVVRRHRRRRLHGAAGGRARRDRGGPEIWSRRAARVPEQVRDRPRARAASRCATSSARRSRPTRRATSAASRWSSSGALRTFLACSGYPDCKNTREVNRPEPTRGPFRPRRRPRVGRTEPIEPRPSRARSAASRWCCAAAASVSSSLARAIPSARPRARSRSRRTARPRPRPTVLLDETVSEVQARSWPSSRGGSASSPPARTTPSAATSR